MYVKMTSDNVKRNSSKIKVDTIFFRITFGESKNMFKLAQASCISLKNLGPRGRKEFLEISSL